MESQVLHEDGDQEAEILMMCSSERMLIGCRSHCHLRFLVRISGLTSSQSAKGSVKRVATVCLWLYNTNTSSTVYASSRSCSLTITVTADPHLHIIQGVKAYLQATHALALFPGPLSLCTIFAYDLRPGVTCGEGLRCPSVKHCLPECARIIWCLP